VKHRYANLDSVKRKIKRGEKVKPEEVTKACLKDMEALARRFFK